MKRTILTSAIMMMVMANNTFAQSLYKKVYELSTEVLNNPKSTEEKIQINQFKVTALNYIAMQVEKRGLKKDSYFYDSQAVNLASFITDFETNLIKARAISSQKRLQTIKCYTDASLNNPLFGDTDKETTHCYVTDKKSYTPFSLDTDWEKAFDTATKKMKEILR